MCRSRSPAPPKCHTFFNRWLTDANTGGLFSQDLRLDLAHSSLTTDVTCVTATGLKFDTQPNDTLINDNITGNQYDTGGPPVTVDIVDSGGNVVDSSAPVTIALGNNPAGATLGGTLTRNAVHGVATFDDLTLDQPDNGYTLTASSSGLTNATSNSFNDNNTADELPGRSPTCSVTRQQGRTRAHRSTSGQTGARLLTGSVDVGTPMDGPGSNPDSRPRLRQLHAASGSADWYEFVVSQPGDSSAAKTITWTVQDDASTGRRTRCASARRTSSMRGVTGQPPVGIGPLQHGTQPDGRRQGPSSGLPSAVQSGCSRS